MAKQNQRDSDRQYTAVTLEGKLHALHHVAWEGLQLVRAMRLVTAPIGPTLMPLVVSAAAIHTRSIGHFLYAQRGSQGVRSSDVLASDFELAPVNDVGKWEEIKYACGKQVAHLTWDRVADRAQELEQLRRWATSEEVAMLLEQLRMMLFDIRWNLGEAYRSVARDGTDYLELFLEESVWLGHVYDAVNEMDGNTSGSGTVPAGDLFDARNRETP